MTTISGFKSTILVNGDALTEGGALTKEPLKNEVIYEYNKKSTIKTVVSDDIIVGIENKINTMKFDDLYIRITRAKIENTPAYIEAVFELPVLAPSTNPTAPSKPKPKP